MNEIPAVLFFVGLILAPWLLWWGVFKRRIYGAKPSVGAYYAVKLRARSYAIMKVLAIDEAGVHILPFDNRYRSMPLQSDVDSLIPQSAIVCISPKRFAVLRPTELLKAEVTQVEAIMYKQWKEQHRENTDVN